VKTPQTPKTEHDLWRGDFLTLEKGAVYEEALRCANCGCVAVSCSDLAPALIALDAQVKTTERTLAAAELFAAQESSTTVLAPDELIKEIVLPAAPEGRQEYLKFRIRNSIDFPIVSLAFYASLTEKKIHKARVVLGAVAPIPMRLREVEAFLEDKSLSDALIADAAALAVKDAQPLTRNKAKVQWSKR
jgi:CO/xanthine dehydrogenase FAD-binding subunit